MGGKGWFAKSTWPLSSEPTKRMPPRAHPFPACRLAGVAMDVYEQEGPLFFKVR